MIRRTTRGRSPPASSAQPTSGEWTSGQDRGRQDRPSQGAGGAYSVLVPLEGDRPRIRFWQPDTAAVTGMPRVDREDRKKISYAEHFTIVVVYEGAFVQNMFDVAGGRGASAKQTHSEIDDPIEVLDVCTKKQIAYLPYFPLAVGNVMQERPVIARIAEAHRATPAQIALARHPPDPRHRLARAPRGELRRPPHRPLARPGRRDRGRVSPSPLTTRGHASRGACPPARRAPRDPSAVRRRASSE